VATVTFNTEPMQYLVATLLRPGTGAATRGVRGLLGRLFAKLQVLFPRARVRVRADAGFADATLLAFLEAAGVEYVLGLPSNRRLDKRVRRLLGRARMRAHHRADGDAVRRDALRRAALGPQATHHHEGRGPLLSRALTQGQSPVPGDQPAASAGHGLHTAVLRPGRLENRLKELQYGVAMDRTSCSRFAANQFRLLLSAAAYVLCQVLQAHARATAVGAAQVWTLRERLLKVAGWVERSVRRIALHLPQTFPWRDAWQQVAHALGAT